MRQLLKIIGLIFFTGAIYGVNAAGEKTAAEFYEKGLQEYNAGKTKEAVIYLKNAIQQDSNYLAAYVLLGKAYLKNGDGAAAEKELSRALRGGADKALVLQPLAESLLIQNKFTEVIKQIPQSGLTNDIQYSLLVARGEAFIEMRKFSEANASYNAAIQLSSTLPQAYLGMAAILIQEQQYGDAEKQISRALDFDRNSARAWQLKAAIAHAQGSARVAVEYYSRALENTPDHFVSLLGRASVLLDLNDFNNAERDIRLLEEKYPLDPRTSYLKYQLLRATGKSDDAHKVLNDAFAIVSKIPQESLNEYSPYLLLAGIIGFELKQHEKAFEYLTTYVKKYPGEIYAEKTLASVLIARGDDREAIRILENVLKKVPNDYQLLTLLGTAYSSARLYLKAEEVFQRAVALQSQATPARFQKALNDISRGQPQNAVEDLELLFEKANDVRSGFMLALLHFKQGNMQKAETTTRKLVKLQPDNIVARNYLAVAQMETGKLGEARKNLQSIVEKDAEFFPAQINLSKIDAEEGRLEDAEKRLIKLLDKKKNPSTVMLALSRLELRRKNLENALRWAEKAYGADSKNIPAILLLFDLQIAAKQFDRALRTSQDGNRAFPDNRQISLALARGYIALGKKDLALSVLRDMVDKASYDSQLLFDIARLQYESGDVGAGVWSLKKAIEGDASFFPARQALIETAISRGELQEAKTHIELIKNYAPKSLYHRLLGDYWMASKHFTQAINEYEAAQSSGLGRDAVLKLYEANSANKQWERAAEHLNQWLKKNPKDVGVKGLLAELWLQQKQPARAAKLYEEIIKIDPNQATSLNNLANIYYESKTPGAIELARRAQQISPDNPDFNDTLGWLLVESGDPNNGLLYLRNANARAATHPEIRYHIAVALHRLNRGDEAKAELRTLLQSMKSDFPSKRQAEQLYKQLN